MRSCVTAAAAVLLLLAHGTAAIELVRRDVKFPVLALPLQRREVASPLRHDRLRRRDAVQQSLDNLETLYFANVSVGTPGQQLRLHLDTGSSDLWTNAASSSLCRGGDGPCARSGTYSANASSSYAFVNSLFDISYVDGSGATGDYVADTLTIGGVDVPALQFGVGYNSSSNEGVMGIGYVVNEVQVNRASLPAYPNLPVKLVEHGLAQSVSYSLWLNDLAANQGAILFGAVDTEKYLGDLATLPILTEKGVHQEFIISLTGIGKDGKAGAVAPALDLPVLLDSGSSLTYLPDNLTTTIYAQFGVKYDSSQQAGIVDCARARDDSTLDFTFTQPTVRVPLKELVIVAGTNRHGANVCIFGINPAGDSTPVLGDTFLRSAYVVYHLGNNEISLAQTNFNATKSNILQVTNGTAGVPHATGVPASTTDIGGVGSGGRNGGQPSVTGTGANPAGTKSAAPAPALAATPLWTVAAALLAAFVIGLCL